MIARSAASTQPPICITGNPSSSETPRGMRKTCGVFRSSSLRILPIEVRPTQAAFYPVGWDDKVRHYYKNLDQLSREPGRDEAEDTRCRIEIVWSHRLLLASRRETERTISGIFRARRKVSTQNQELRCDINLLSVLVCFYPKITHDLMPDLSGRGERQRCPQHLRCPQRLARPLREWIEALGLN